MIPGDTQIFRQYASLARKWLWLIVLGMLLAGSTALIVSLSLPSIYEATATLYVTPGDNPSISAKANIQASQLLAVTYAELIKKPVMLKAAASRLDIESIDEDAITANPIPNTELITLQARDADPQRAADIANILPIVFQERNEELQTKRFMESKEPLSKELSWLQSEIEATQARITALGQPSTAAEEAELSRLEATLAQYRASYATVLSNYEAVRLAEVRTISSIVVYEQAAVPTDPILPRIWQNTLVAVLVGAALAIGITGVVEYLDDTLKSSEDVSAVLGLNTLGSVARIRTEKRGDPMESLIATSSPKSPASEAYRTLRTNIQFSGVDKPIRRLLVTSAGPTEGKSLTAANLAIVMAQAGQSVILVDGDLRRPTLHKLFQMSNEVGVTNGLIDGSNPGLDRYLLPTFVENLRLLSSGPLPPNPSELLGSQRMSQFIEQLEDQADVIVFDSPPVLAVTDAAVLSRQVDGVLLIVEANGTREADARRAVEELSNVDAPILGGVLNKVPVRRGRGYGYYYGKPDTQDAEA